MKLFLLFFWANHTVQSLEVEWVCIFLVYFWKNFRTFALFLLARVVLGNLCLKGWKVLLLEVFILDRVLTKLCLCICFWRALADPGAGVRNYCHRQNLLKKLFSARKLLETMVPNALRCLLLNKQNFIELDFLIIYVVFLLDPYLLGHSIFSLYPHLCLFF